MLLKEEGLIFHCPGCGQVLETIKPCRKEVHITISCDNCDMRVRYSYDEEYSDAWVELIIH
jgi:predicted RNA-binding Zn-ribbon protein involved in translation (DUF1610 family)